MTSITMFTGKGGVGKTTCAAATALYRAASGNPTLTISTDATPSLSHIFAVNNGCQPAADVPPALHIVEIGERQIKQMWDEKFGRDVHEVFSAFVDIGYEEFVEFMTSILPGLGEEFMVDYIREMSHCGRYENIVWDTAPLGQTLSLLQTPALLGDHLRMAPRIYSRLKIGRRHHEPVLNILKRWEVLSAANMEFLRNEVDFNIVTIPEALAVEQLEGVFLEFDKFGLKIRRLLVNNVVKNEDSPFLQTKAKQQRIYLDHIHATYTSMEIVELPLFSSEIRGRDRLQEMVDIIYP